MRWQSAKVYVKYLAIFACFSIFLCGKNARAAESTTLRIISTADIHSQISDENYDNGGIDKNQSLAKLSTMIKGARAEITQGGSITVDAGDSIYGYGAELIMGGEKKADSKNLQPVYMAMKKINYDAMTLGNHEFDYGFDYIKKQISQAELTKTVVVANVKDLNTNTYPWQKTKMITRQLITSQGERVSVKIGIIGVTNKDLSTYYDYNGILQGESVLKTVREQSANLKKSGADIVVVVAHCGIGDEKANDASVDAGYALTKLANVDCVMLGHQHINYPSDDEDTKDFYKLPNVDKRTGLINGKPVTMVADHAAGIGVADLELKVENGKVKIVGAKAEIRKSSILVKADPDISEVTNQYDSLIKNTYNDVLAKVDSDSNLSAFFGMLEDSYAIQLNNESKIQYGLKYIHSVAGANYAKYPVIAASRFYMDGSEGKNDYIDISDAFTMKSALNIQQYLHDNNYAFWITGAQLKKWMEWSASIFAQSDEKITSDTVMEKLMQQENASSIISNEWVNNWSQYAIFDGLEYQIDASVPPRYSVGGQLIHPDANRIKNLTCNGKKVGDNTKFIVVGNYVYDSNPVLGFLFRQRLTAKSPQRSAYYLRDYVKEIGDLLSLRDDADHNWSVTFGNTTRYVVRSSALSDLIAKTKVWYQKTLLSGDDYNYYLADLSKTVITEDNYGPLLVLAPSTKAVTNKNVIVYIQASDTSGISSIKYQEGIHQKTETSWDTDVAKVATNSAITIKNNGEYSVCAVDKNGNKTVKPIKINNINTKILEVPTVAAFSNKMKAITGVGQPGLTVHIKLAGKNYTTTVRSDGKYSCNVAKANANAGIQVYVSDKQGRVSSTIKSKVLRRGPNSPTLDTVSNKTTTVHGKVNDKNSVILLYVGDKVYIPRDKGTSFYKNCKAYNKKRKMRYANSYKVSNGKYTIKIPIPLAKTAITAFGVDTNGRISLVTKKKIAEEGPNQPKVNPICDAEKCVTGNVPKTTKKCNVTVKVGNRSFSSMSTKTGKFIVKTVSLKSGATIRVKASDVKKGKKRQSAEATCIVKSQDDYVKEPDKSQISANTITSKTLEVKGKSTSKGNIYINYGKTSAQLDMNSNGSFSYSLPSPLSVDSVVYIVRHNKSTGEIEEVKKYVVKATKPLPVKIITKKITQKTKKIEVLAKERAEVVIKAKGKRMIQAKCKYSMKKRGFVYSVKVPKGCKKMSFVLKNKIGTSKAKMISIKKK